MAPPTLRPSAWARRSGGLVAWSRQLDAYALDRLRALVDVRPPLGDVRGLGLLMRIEVVRHRSTRARAIDETETVMDAALDRIVDVRTAMGSVINLSPPLVIAGEDMDAAIEILDAAIGEVEPQLGYAS